MNYDDSKLQLRYTASTAARRGTELHRLAHDCIRLGVRLNRDNHALATYVNDAIGYKMTSENPLYYSDNCFGTPDTMSFRRRKLRIHDLKTGLMQTKFNQLEVYCALFCLEYEVSPFDIEMECRIYQGEEVRIHEPDPEVIQRIMDTIVSHDSRIEMFQAADLV